MASYYHKYYYFYKITNILNEHYYYGVHQTDNLDDGYMGSGTRLHRAYEKYGIENFKKEILKYFDNAEDMYNYEESIVTEELTKNENCYNIIKGGLGDSHPFSNVTTLKGFVTVKNNEGEIFRVSVDDERYISGELVHISTGIKHTESARYKMSQHHKLHKQQAGEKNSQYGIRFVSRKNDNGEWETKKIAKEELEVYLSKGWIKANVFKYKDSYLNDKIIEKELAKSEKKTKKQQSEKLAKDVIYILETKSNIDFTKFGWVNLAHNYLRENYSNIYKCSNCQNLHKFIKKYDSNFFERTNAFVRKTTAPIG